MKSSHLTRAVFRAILANRPYPVAHCQWRPRKANTLNLRYDRVPNTQRRSLFTALLGTVNLQFEGAKPTPQNLELALGKLVDLVRARRSNSRTPANDELLGAFKFIFAARLQAQRRLTRSEVFLVTEAFKYFKERGLVNNDAEPLALKKNDLNLILSTLALPSHREKFRTDTTALATLVFGSLPSTAAELETSQVIDDKPTSALGTYIVVLAQTGSATEALRLLEDSEDTHVKENIGAWIEVIKGLANEGRRSDFQNALAKLKLQSSSFSAAHYEALITFLAHNHQSQSTRQFYDLQLQAQLEPSTTQLQRLIELCVKYNHHSWASGIAKLLLQRVHDPQALGALLIWQASRENGAGPIINKTEQFIHDTALQILTIESFNRLLEFGLDEKRPDIVSAALELTEVLDVRPDGKTYALQLKNALENNDLARAILIYEQTVHQDTPRDDSDLPTLNRFLADLAFSPQPPYTLIIRVIDSILERNADFDADALAGLCKIYLERNELDDVVGLLRHRADFYPETDRARIAAVFREFILDPLVSDQKAYNAYEIYRHAFPETPVDKTVTIMQSFFDRDRADFACTVFSHMRQREDLEARPTSEAYARCFAGVAKCKDIDGLQIIHNMLKLDLEVEPTTRIRNGMMLAYIACNLPFTAMIDNFWKILDSAEGPSYSTFEIGLRACETWIPQGGHEARKIIAIMQAWNLEITKELYDCYIGAIAGQSEFEYAVELIEEMKNDIGEHPDAITIGTFYNAIPWQYRKDEVEKWAKKAYPDLWEDLLAYGDVVDEEWEIRFFKIPRDIDINDDPLFETGKYDPQISRRVVQALETPSSG